MLFKDQLYSKNKIAIKGCVNFYNFIRCQNLSGVAIQIEFSAGREQELSRASSQFLVLADLKCLSSKLIGKKYFLLIFCAVWRSFAFLIKVFSCSIW